MSKKRAGLPLSPYEEKIVGPTGYRWVESTGGGVFITSPLDRPLSAADRERAVAQWRKHTERRNEAAKAQRAKDPTGLGDATPPT